MRLCALALAFLPAIAFAEGALVEGNPSSPVRAIIYEDLQCPDCAAFRQMMDDKILPRYKDKVAFEHRDFPLPKHAWARRAAIAARFFQEVRPDLGVEFRRHILANIKAIMPGTLGERIAAFAKQNGIDAAKAVASFEDARLAALVEKDYQEGIARGVARTPTVLVNGQPFIETFTFEEISKYIEEQLR